MKTDNDCNYCNARGVFTNISPNWDPSLPMLYGAFEKAWNNFLNNGVDHPEELRHGLPADTSMMIWREGFQHSTSMLMGLQIDPTSGQVKLSGNLMIVECCPMCGRPLWNHETEEE